MLTQRPPTLINGASTRSRGNRELRRSSHRRSKARLLHDLQTRARRERSCEEDARKMMSRISGMRTRWLAAMRQSANARWRNFCIIGFTRLSAIPRLQRVLHLHSSKTSHWEQRRCSLVVGAGVECEDKRTKSIVTLLRVHTYRRPNLPAVAVYPLPEIYFSKGSSNNVPGRSQSVAA